MQHYQSEVTLQDTLNDMLQTTPVNIEEFADTVIYFTGILVETITLTATIGTYSNQKPWVDSIVHTALKVQAITYSSELTSGDLAGYKATSNALMKFVKAPGTRWYKDKVESYFKHRNSPSIWDGLRTIMDNKPSIGR